MLLFTTVFLFCLSPVAKAQSPGETVEMFFTAMNSSDVTAIKSLVDEQCTLQTIAYSRQSQKTELHSVDLEDFYHMLEDKQPDMKFEEKIYNLQVNQDCDMAVVWAPYKFYINEKFSHCGVNLFTLAFISENWKVLSITDTRRKENCVTDQ